ncbi:hypothetical protein AB0G02_17795 [Actinosynnema sp. NPDC023658]|uniref:hypothetical protein n=1 Tax=Actinosynnema sp. NPDC023658 TaxID=3155465 RepID=UPI00340F0349
MRGSLTVSAGHVTPSGSSTAPGAGTARWVVAGAVPLVAGPLPTRAVRGRRAASDE